MADRFREQRSRFQCSPPPPNSKMTRRQAYAVMLSFTSVAIDAIDEELAWQESYATLNLKDNDKLLKAMAGELLELQSHVDAFLETIIARNKPLREQVSKGRRG